MEQGQWVSAETLMPPVLGKEQALFSFTAVFPHGKTALFFTHSLYLKAISRRRNYFDTISKTKKERIILDRPAAIPGGGAAITLRRRVGAKPR